MGEYISSEGIHYEGVLREIRRSKVALQPVYEAFTNSLEAIELRAMSQDFNLSDGRISMSIYVRNNTDGSKTFEKLTIKDNGIGFNDKEFNRFNRYRDFTKGFKNLGSGRVQFAHYFDRTEFISTYLKDGKFYERKFLVSKREEFLRQNAITRLEYNQASSSTETGTLVTFHDLLDQTRNKYHELNDQKLKEDLLKRYIPTFCLKGEDLPKISISYYVHYELEGSEEIQSQDVPTVAQKDRFRIPYLELSEDANRLVESDKEEEFEVSSFLMSKDELGENAIKVTSKGEIVEGLEVNLESLPALANVKGNRYLFLLESDYIDRLDTNERGEFNLVSKTSLKKKGKSHFTNEIFIEDIEKCVNESIHKMHPEILDLKKDHESSLRDLKDMFLLSDEYLNELKISVNDTEGEILEKFYKAEAKRSATLDSKLKSTVDTLGKLDTTSDNYLEQLHEIASTLTKLIPQQNKADLTHYIARRKLVLELFQKILDKELHIQNNGSRNKDEALLHNLIFQQNSDSPEKSDLWLISEDYLFFKGTSESQLMDISFDGKKVIRESLSSEEEEYIRSFGENRLATRPDILLFPKESKCIIIEFKNPNAKVSEHLDQINNYAALLRNFTTDEFTLKSFYGYLIGEKVNGFDVRAHDGDFKEAYHFDYLYRPSKTIPGFFKEEGNDGNLYTEVIKYSTILERAIHRNQVFIDHLMYKKMK